jgi:hypothetical protein
MPKEYFSHDYNARHDRKIAALVREHKAAGYGIFWATCEMMHEEGGTLELDEITYSAIAKDVNEEIILLKKVIEDCIAKFKLFTVNEEKLNSNRIKHNLHKRLSISKIRSNAGKAGAIAKQKQANGKQNQANKRKENKEKKVNKNKENFPVSDSLNGLPSSKTNAAIEIIQLSQNITTSKDQINGFWNVFKIQKLTGENYYGSDEKVYDHFINWVKTQKISELTKTIKKGEIYL